MVAGGGGGGAEGTQKGPCVKTVSIDFTCPPSLVPLFFAQWERLALCFEKRMFPRTWTS